MNVQTLQRVAIDRGNDVVTAVVPEHEVEVLKAVHGPNAVRMLDTDYDDAEYDANADAEYARLQRKYGRINDEDRVRIAFPGGPRDLERYGFKLTGNVGHEAPQALVEPHVRRKLKKAA